MKEWLAAYVRLYHEKKTRDNLKSLGIECFLPLQEEVHQWSDRKKKVERVVISMMIFVHVAPEERIKVLQLPAVSRYLVLRGESTPAVIPEKEMQQFMFMLDNSDETVEMSDAPLTPGQKIRVVKGPLRGLEGELITVNGKKKIAVRIDCLGYATINMTIGMIEVIK
jgi:transcription termination/antitermination protein NusG